MIAIVDYGTGNLRSVTNAFDTLGYQAQIVAKPEMLNTSSAIVLPGVGAFGDGMKHLHAAGWVDALTDQVIHKTKPFLGICLGMQLIAASGMEHGYNKGLNWVSGVVDRLPNKNTDLPIPHIGWNDVIFSKNSKLFANLGESQTFYFVHSYALTPDNANVISGQCEYGSKFAAAIEQDNIWAVQFHPEKSQKAGLKIFENFIKEFE